MSQKGILKCSYVLSKDFCKFKAETFCQKLKIFMTVVLSEISDFDHFFNIINSDLSKFQVSKWYSKVFFC